MFLKLHKVIPAHIGTVFELSCNYVNYWLTRTFSYYTGLIISSRFINTEACVCWDFSCTSWGFKSRTAFRPCLVTNMLQSALHRCISGIGFFSVGTF